MGRGEVWRSSYGGGAQATKEGTNFYGGWELTHLDTMYDQVTIHAQSSSKILHLFTQTVPLQISYKAIFHKFYLVHSSKPYPIKASEVFLYDKTLKTSPLHSHERSPSLAILPKQIIN